MRQIATARQVDVTRIIICSCISILLLAFCPQMLVAQDSVVAEVTSNWMPLDNQRHRSSGNFKIPVGVKVVRWDIISPHAGAIFFNVKRDVAWDGRIGNTGADPMVFENLRHGVATAIEEKQEEYSGLYIADPRGAPDQHQFIVKVIRIAASDAPVARFLSNWMPLKNQKHRFISSCLQFSIIVM